ncbi:MAG: glycosyltransferase family 61 protein, partial [Proteobacteria bacterium]|nr:glycosyltransferase family 61 protein [Pseudomonadota bacterium]
AIWAERDHCTFLGGEYIPLYGRWSENFYHWVWENVPAIIMAETAGYRGNYIACSNKYIPQIFEMLGVSINRVFGYRGGSFRVEKLYAPVRPTANSLTAVPGLFLETRNRMLNAAGGPKDSVHRKLYISRSKSNRPRQVINESDVLDVVTRYGFEPVCLEDHSVREQVALMSTAVAIIGPHGAGVTQCMFARPRSLIVEFFAPTYINTAIMAALKILNHKYYPLTSQNWTVQYPHGDHILVYADLLDHILRQEYVR